MEKIYRKGKIYWFTESTAIFAVGKRKYSFIITCCPYYLSPKTIMRLNELKNRYLDIQKSYQYDENLKDRWCLNGLLKKDFSWFWDEVKGILMKRGAFFDIPFFSDEATELNLEDVMEKL